MAILLKGAPVAKALNDETADKVKSLKAQGIDPTLAVLRVGERPDDLSYERNVEKKTTALGITLKKIILTEDVSAEAYYETIKTLNGDDQIHGVLMFRPLPKHIDEKKACDLLSPKKDIDGCTLASLGGVFTGTNVGFAPCTAQAVMEILHHYDITIKGKKAAVIGRSLVVGRPLAMMLMTENATVTICHTKTQDVPAICRDAELVIAASGQMESINADYLRSGQVIIDVGIGWNDAKQKLCGDVDFDSAEPIAEAITPVPGGVGVVTTAVLMRHVVESASKS